MEDGFQVIETSLPALITATRKLNQPRYMNIPDIVRISTSETPIQVWGIDDLGLLPDEVGLKGSPTRVKRSFSPTPSSEVEFITGSVEEMASTLLSTLQRLNLVQK